MANGWAAPTSAICAVIVTVVTLVYQVKQWDATLAEQRDAAEDQQWTDVMKQISLKDPSTVQVGAFGLESFFESKRRGSQAREVASAILPFADSNVGFDVVWKGLVKHTTQDNQTDLIAVARQISLNERDLFDGLKSRHVPEHCPVAEIADFLNAADKCYPFHEGTEPPQAKSAWLYSWEVDSTTDTLAKIWHDKDKHISPTGGRLSGIIFAHADQVDFRNLDFSDSYLDGSVFHSCDIEGANFKGATMTGAEFHHVLNFASSTWEKANWWAAQSISPCSLLEYLNSNYPPPTDISKDRTDRLHRGCRTQKSGKEGDHR